MNMENAQLEIINRLANTSRLLVTGREGSGKSTLTLRALIENGNKTVFACQSYEQLAEKQAWVMEQYNFTEQECPIVAEATTTTNFNYVTTKSRPSAIPSEAKIIFCTHTFVSQAKVNNHRQLQDCVLVVDECRVDMLLLGGTDTILFENANDISDSDVSKDFGKRLANFTRFKYGKEDSQVIVNQFNTKNPMPFVRAWLQTEHKIIFLTSEKLMSSILTTPVFGFTEFDLSDGKQFDGIFFHVMPRQVTKEFYEVMDTRGGWLKLGTKFDQIISDSVQTEDVAISHARAMGSNQMMGKTILSIVSQIPKQSITKIAENVNKIHGKELFTVNQIAALFYRDRIAQAIGRNTGFRGNGPHYLLVNSQIWQTIESEYSSLDFPVGFQKWQEDEYTRHIDKFITLALEEMGRDKKSKKDRVANILGNIINVNFEPKIGATLTKIELDQMNLMKPNKTRLKLSDIADHFGLGEVYRVMIDGERTYALDGVCVR